MAASPYTSDGPPASAFPNGPPPPAVAKRFFTEFVSRMYTHRVTGVARESEATHRREENGENDKGTELDEDAALRRLSQAQADALSPLLWQWLLLLYAEARTSPSVAEAKPELPRGESTAHHRHSSTAASSCVKPTLTPPQVESLFHTGLSALLPAARPPGTRAPPSDLYLPWQHTSDPTVSVHDTLEAALTRLSRKGPLFTSWCSLCYVGLAVAAGRRREEEGFGNDVAAKEIMAKVRAAWDAAVAHRCGPPSLTDGGGTDRTATAIDEEAPRTVDVDTVQLVWRDVHHHLANTTFTSKLATSLPSSSLPAHTLFTTWVSQWFYECCRVASHGRDTGLGTDTVPLTVLTRVHHYLCSRLKEETERAAQSVQHERSSGAAIVKSMEDIEGTPLIVATLTGLAVHAPTVTAPTPSAADQGGGGGTFVAHRRVHRRKRQRSLRNSCYGEDDNVEGEDGGVDVADGVGDGPSSLHHFLIKNTRIYEVKIASSVLTTYAMTPAMQRARTAATTDDCVGDSPHYSVELQGEVFLRQGEVQWWTLGDSQRHRRLMFGKRS